MINIHSLNKERLKLEQKRQEVYKKILLRIHNKIKIANKLNNFCYYEIPIIILGMPLFNIHKCSDYIYDQLLLQGFKVTRIKFNNFMIYWGHIEEESTKLKENTTNDMNINSTYNSNNYRDIRNITKNTKNFIYDI